MANRNKEKTTQEPEGEELSAAYSKKSLGTLPKGGMSPLADRENPGAWTAPKAPLDAREVRISPLDDGRKEAPEEPVGGWVDASGGRGRIRLRGDVAQDWKPSPPAPPRRRTVAVKNKEYPDMASRAAIGRPRARLRRRARDSRAAAEAAAKERQEEDRNYQDAVKDMDADEDGYEDGEF